MIKLLKYLFFVFIFTLPLHAQTVKKHHHIPWGPIIRGTLHFTATAMDVQGTQRCLHELPTPGCVEANPLMPEKAWQAWTLNMSITGASTLLDFENWKNHRKFGWITPVEGITEHTVGAVTGWTK